MSETRKEYGFPIQRGSIGKAVFTLQARLNVLEGRDMVTVDGVFGPETEAALKRYQEARGLPVNGIADGGVWESLLKKRKRGAN